MDLSAMCWVFWILNAGDFQTTQDICDVLLQFMDLLCWLALAN